MCLIGRYLVCKYNYLLNYFYTNVKLVLFQLDPKNTMTNDNDTRWQFWTTDFSMLYLTNGMVRRRNPVLKHSFRQFPINCRGIVSWAIELNCSVYCWSWNRTRYCHPYSQTLCHRSMTALFVNWKEPLIYFSNLICSNSFKYPAVWKLNPQLNIQPFNCIFINIHSLLAFKCYFVTLVQSKYLAFLDK